jgi:hypothetical protein
MAKAEVLLPQPGGELRDIGGRVLADALEDVDEIVVGIDVVQATGGDQALDDPHIGRRARSSRTSSFCGDPSESA